MFCRFEHICSEKKKNATFVPLGLIVKGCKCIQSPKGSSTCCLYERADMKLVFHQNFFLVLRQIKRSICLHKMTWFSEEMSTQKNQALTLKTKSEPQSQEWHTKKIQNKNQAHVDSNAYRESLPQGSTTTLKWDFPNYSCFMVSLGTLDITCRLWLAASLSHHKLFVFLDGSPSVLASPTDYLLIIQIHILPLLSLLGFKRALASFWEQMMQPLSWAESTTQHHWANLPATQLKCHPSPVSVSQLFLHKKWHFTGMRKQHVSTKQACILDWLKSRCMHREVFFDGLLHLSHSLAWGRFQFQGAAQEVGKRNVPGSYVEVFYASKEKYIGGIIWESTELQMLAGIFVKDNIIRHPVPIYFPWVLEPSPLHPCEIAGLVNLCVCVLVLDLCLSAVDSAPGQMISLTVHYNDFPSSK